MANKIFPKNTIWRKGGWWVKKNKRYRRLYYHGLCLFCNCEIWKELSPKSHKYTYCSKKCSGVSQNFGEQSRNYKGGRKIDVHGYIWLYCPKHPNSTVDGYVKEHRFVMSNFLKRPLNLNEAVHHINGNRADNRIMNLCLMKRGKHTSLHLKGRKLTIETKNKLSEWHKKHPQKRDAITKRFTGEYL